jgi:hypothetical protein
MANTTLDVFSFDGNSTLDCGNATFDADTGSCSDADHVAAGNDVTAISNMTCGKQEYFSSTYALVGTSVQV